MQGSSDMFAPLWAYLTPAQSARLRDTGDLPAAERTHLAAQLHAELVACAAFIPARLVQAQLRDPQPGRISGAFWDGSLLFADLSGFTALSEQLSVLGRQGSEEVSAVVNALFSALVAEIQAQYGVLLKFGGDALTAFFDAETLGSAHATAAVSAAIAMQQRMREFVDLPTRAGTFTLRLRVGVHSGRVFAAEVGDASHLELVVTGPEVNRVAYAQEIAAPGETVITATTAAHLTAAKTTPAADGFVRIDALPPVALPAAPANPIPALTRTDLPALLHLAAQVQALRPYLVRGLPPRFLASNETGLGEFRPVTVLFANLLDFSQYLPHFADAADQAAQIFNAYFRRAQAVVHRYEGSVNKVDMATHGDKLMVLFGAPTAHEDDPRRATFCALDLKKALDEANAEISAYVREHVPIALDPPLHPLVQKIGINAGTVFAGRVGGLTRYEYTVMGSAVNLAARLMAAAPAGTIYLAPTLQASVSSQVNLRNGPPLQLKGIAEPVVPSIVVGIGSSVAATNTAMGLKPGQLIGRDAELQAMLTATQTALGGSGRTVALIGDAGTGKSRLYSEFFAAAIAASMAPPGTANGMPSFTMLFHDCQSYEQRTPYAGVRPLVRELLELSSSTQNSTALGEQVRKQVHMLVPERERFWPLLGDMLGHTFDETPLTLALNPQQRHDRLHELVIDLLRVQAQREPILITIEDAHWADASSLDLFGRIATAISEMAVLLLLTYRPNPPISAPWLDLPSTTTLALRDLSPTDSTALIASLLEGRAPAGLEQIVERTQGNPFFIEELVRALIAGQILVRDSSAGWLLSRPLDAVTLPTSIEGLLTASLDRLDEPRQELLQVASVIGRRFQRPVVAGVYPNTLLLDESLKQLLAIELLLADQYDPVLSYLFRHALLRDVAYERILYARRRVLHAQVARMIEQLHATLIDDQIALLAWHYLRAEEWPHALDYHLRAAEQAQKRFANRDALALYHTALELLPKVAALDPKFDPSAQAAHIHEALGAIYLRIGENDQADEQFSAALHAIDTRGPVSEQWLRLHRLLASVDERRSHYEAAFAHLHTGIVKGNRAELRVELMRCHLLGAGLYYRQGIYDKAMEWVNLGLRYDPHEQYQAEQTHAQLMKGNIWRDQGDLSQAIEAFERVRQISTAQNDLTRLGDALNNLGILYTRAGRWPETIASFERSLEISEMIGDVQATARTANNLAVVQVGRNQLDEAARLYQMSSNLFGQIGSVLGVAVTTYNRGEVLLYQQRPAEALPLFAQAIADMERINARSFLPDVLRLQAEAHLALEQYVAAHDLAGRALEIAQELGMGAEVAVARRVLGQIALARQDLATAAAQFSQSQAELIQVDNRYELGRTIYQRARLARAQGDDLQRAQFCTEAASIFRELDAQRDLELLRAVC
jgi:class 3 adenylate cyclase/tetratricopeptide (TPR) repeat protein